MIKHLIIACLFVFVSFGISFSQDKPEENAPAEKANERPVAPPQKPEPYDQATVDEMANTCAKIETAVGEIKLEFFPNFAPLSVKNFLNLVATGVLDNTTFSRVVPNFVIQGGDLWSNENATTETKWRGARELPDEPNQIKHEAGILSMARGDEPNSATTSFFILLNTAPYLDGKFAAFGRVTDGMDVVKAINEMPVENEKPKEPVRITKTSVIECASKEEPTN